MSTYITQIVEAAIFEDTRPILKYTVSRNWASIIFS